MLEAIDRYLSSGKQPLSNEQKAVRMPRNLFIINDEEVHGRKEVRSYNGATIEEICQRFLFYRENQNVNNGQKNKDKLVEMFNIVDESEYLVLKDGKKFIDDALKIYDNDSKSKLGSALIAYLLYKMNGGR